MNLYSPGWDSEQKMLGDTFVEFMKDATVTELSIVERGYTMSAGLSAGRDQITGNETVTLEYDGYFPFLMAKIEFSRVWLPTHLTLAAVKKYDSQCNVMKPEEGKDFLTLATKLRDKNYLGRLTFFREELLTSFPYGKIGGGSDVGVLANTDQLPNDLGAQLRAYAIQGHSAALPSRGEIAVTFAPMANNGCSADVTYSRLDWKTDSMKRVDVTSGTQSLTSEQSKARLEVIAANKKAKMKAWFHNAFKPKARKIEAQLQPVTSKREYACRNAFDIAVENAKNAMNR